jgi:hypothetical protein
MMQLVVPRFTFVLLMSQCSAAGPIRGRSTRADDMPDIPLVQGAPAEIGCRRPRAAIAAQPASPESTEQSVSLPSIVL